MMTTLRLSLLIAFATAYCLCATAQPEYLSPAPDYNESNTMRTWATDNHVYLLSPWLLASNPTQVRSGLWCASKADQQLRPIKGPLNNSPSSTSHVAQVGQTIYMTSYDFPDYWLHAIQDGAMVDSVALPLMSRVVQWPSAWGLSGIGCMTQAAVQDLWYSDGTAQGTHLVAAGAQSVLGSLGSRLLMINYGGWLVSLDSLTDNPTPIAEVGQHPVTSTPVGHMDSILLFNTAQGTWRTDGTAAGTYLLMPGRQFNEFVSNGARGLLRYNAPQFGPVEMWGTDGTVAGTQQLSTFANFSTGFRALGGDLFFYGLEPDTKELSLWRSDGTPEGTFLALPLSQGYGIREITRVFQVDSTWALLEVLELDGTPKVFTFDTEALWPLPAWLTPSNAFFLNGEFGYQSPYSNLKVIDGHLYAPLQHPEIGIELWRLSRRGELALVADMAPGVRWSAPRILWGAEGSLYLLGKTPDQGPGLYRLPMSDLTAELPVYTKDYDWATGIIPVPWRPWNNSMFTIYNGGVLAAPSGNLYTTGINDADGGMAFPGQEVRLSSTLQSSRVSNYLARLDGRTGRVIWVRGGSHLGEVSHVMPALATAPGDGVYIAHDFDFRLNFGDTTVQNNGIKKGYVARYDSTGHVLWHQVLDMSGSQSSVLGIVSAPDGSVYVSGTFRFYTGRIGGVRLSAGSSPAGYVARFSHTGEVLGVTTFDLPFYWRLWPGKELPLSLDSEGRVYVAFNELGPSTTQGCGSRPRSTLLRCYAPDLSRLEWQRDFSASDYAYVGGIAMDKQDNLYMVGRYRGKIQMDGQVISAECEAATGFVAVMDKRGRLVSLADFAPENISPIDLKFDSQGAYVLTGLVSYPGNVNRRYEGYDRAPFANGRLSVAVQRRHPITHELLSERHFLKPSQDDRWHDHYPQIALLPDDDVVLADRMSSDHILDTLAGFPYTGDYRYGASALVRFSLPESHYDGPPKVDLDLLDDDGLRIGPNPTDGLTYLQLPFGGDFTGLSFSMYNTLGQQVAFSPQNMTNASWQIDMRQLPTGMYWLRLSLGDWQRAVKIIRN